MKKSEFLLEVKAELDIIKSKATKEEIGKLNMDTFEHSLFNTCIYGQMTGSCSSDRAKEMMPKTYGKIKLDNNKRIFFRYIPFYKQSISKLSQEFTPLEKYLYMVRKSMHDKIISYLKNEIDTIELI